MRRPESGQIRFVGELSKLEIAADDRFVLHVDRSLTAQIVERIHSAWRTFAGEGVQLLVLERGMKLDAINVSVSKVQD